MGAIQGAQRLSTPAPWLEKDPLVQKDASRPSKLLLLGPEYAAGYLLTFDARVDAGDPEILLFTHELLGGNGYCFRFGSHGNETRAAILDRLGHSLDWKTGATPIKPGVWYEVSSIEVTADNVRCWFANRIRALSVSKPSAAESDSEHSRRQHSPQHQNHSSIGKHGAKQGRYLYRTCPANETLFSRHDPPTNGGVQSTRSPSSARTAT